MYSVALPRATSQEATKESSLPARRERENQDPSANRRSAQKHSPTVLQADLGPQDHLALRSFPSPFSAWFLAEKGHYHLDHVRAVAAELLRGDLDG